MINKTINELLDTFIYLCDQHGILIQATSITEDSFRFKPNIIITNSASVGLSDDELIAKCNDLAVSVGLAVDGNKCYLQSTNKLSTKSDKK